MIAVRAAARNLLTTLDPLPYRQRMERLARWARSAPDRAEVCAELRGEGAYERHLALVAAMVGHDVEAIRAATRDPQPSIRIVALRAAVAAGMVTAYDPAWSAAERRAVYRTLRRLPLPSTADALIGAIRSEHGDGEGAAVLPGCGPGTVRALLPALEHAVNLTVLARRYPDLVLERVAARLAAAAPERRPGIWAEVAGAVLLCAPSGALDLLERYGPDDRLPGELTAYGALVADHPHRVVRLLTDPGRAAWLGRTVLPPALLRRLAVLPTDELLLLARRTRDNSRALAALLDAVAPARRRELYDGATADVDTTALVPAHRVMEVLPAAVRVREATRVLGLAKIRDRADQVLTWSSYLGWPEASAALRDALRSGEADERARAYALLADAARRSRDPQAVTQVVAGLERLRNEQDPVRAAALTAFARLAPLLTAATAAGLTRVTTDAAEARDASFATTSALSSLAAAVLQHHVGVPELRDWALLTIDRVSSGTHVPTLHRFDRVLRRGQETMVVDRLRGWVEAAAARGRYGPLFALIRALGRRAWRVPELQEMLHRAVGPRTTPAVASEAVRLWLDDPRHRGDRVAEVLSVDPSTATIPVVWETLCTARTDLLDRVLDRPPRGRFIEAGLHWVPGQPRHPERWLPRQQAAFVALQQRVLADRGAEVWRRAAAIRAAAGVPLFGRELLLRHVEAAEVVIAEAALGGLVRTDRPDEALPTLLRFADGDRARVALYAAGRAVRYVAPGRLAAPLRAVLIGPSRITSRKEAARLLARYGPPGEMAALAEVHANPATHRDVRTAIIAAARQRLDVRNSWEVLEAGGTRSREERRAVLSADPSTVAEAHRSRYARLIVTACRDADAELRRTAFDRLPEWSPWVTGVTELVVDRLADLREQIDAADVAPLLRAGGNASLGAALGRLVDHDTADGDPGGPAADRPARRRIETLAQGAADRSRGMPAAADRSELSDAARWLAGRPGFARPATALLVALGRLDDLDEVAGLCADRPVLAVHTAARVAERLHELPEALDPAVLHPAVTGLAARGDLAGGLFAVALVAPGAASGWSAPWRELLLDLRRHPDADVRDEAYRVDMS
jgi:hypothetical protein